MVKYSLKKRKNKLYTRKRVGGSYPVPLRSTDIPLNNNYSVKYICSHGEISPDVFYIIPPNVYLLFPNICGVATATIDTVLEPIFTDLHTANNIFTQKFIEGELSERGTNFTVFVPGDIIPMQTFIFSPIIGKPRPLSFNIGFVGVFNPAALENNYIYKTIKTKRVDESMFTLSYDDGLSLLYNILNYFRTYLKNDTIKTGSLYSIYINICYEILREKEISIQVKTQDLINHDIRFIILYPYRYLKNNYNKSMIDYKLLRIKKSNLLKYISILFPLLKQNIMSDLLGERVLESFRETRQFTKIGHISLKEIIDTTKDNDKPTFYVVNACRSLPEMVNDNFVESEASGAASSARAIGSISEEVVSDVATSLASTKTLPKKYTEVNLRKYSGKIISLIDNLCKNENADGCTNLNIININNLRLKKGLQPIKQTVLNYNTLFQIIKETIEAPGNMNTVLGKRLQASMRNLESYVPKENTRATQAIIEQVSTAKEQVLKQEAEDVISLKAALEKRKKVIKSKIRDLKFHKSKNYMNEIKLKEDELKNIQTQLNAL